MHGAFVHRRVQAELANSQADPGNGQAAVALAVALVRQALWHTRAGLRQHPGSAALQGRLEVLQKLLRLCEQKQEEHP